MTPAHLAVVHVLNDHAAESPDHCARQILDALRDHGWRPPPTAEAIPPAGRRACDCADVIGTHHHYRQTDTYVPARAEARPTTTTGESQ